MLTLNIFHTFFYCCYCSQWTGKYLSRIVFLCKCQYPKYKDKQMLCLASFKIVADFLNNLNFLDISLQVHNQLIFPEKEILFFQPSYWNWKCCKLGTRTFFSFFIEIFRSVSLMGRYIQNSCFFDSLFFERVYN